MNINRCSPILAILKCYTQWWVTWVFAAVYVLWLTSGYYLSLRDDAYGALPGESVFEKAFRTEVAGGHEFPSPSSESFRTLKSLKSIAHITDVYIDDQHLDEAFQKGSPLFDQKALPNLICVNTRIREEEQLLRLLKDRHIKWLILRLDAELSESTWQAFRDSSIENLILVAKHEVRMWPHKLRRLEYFTSWGGFSTNLSEGAYLKPLKLLPRLDFLVIQVNSPEVDQAVVRALRQTQPPKQLYVFFFDEHATIKEQNDLGIAYQRQLRGMTLGSVGYSIEFVCSSLWIAAGGLFPMMFVLNMLQIQFAKTGAVLLPQFQRFHFPVAFGILAILSAMQIGALTFRGCDPLAATAVTGSGMIVFYLSLLTARRYSWLLRLILIAVLLAAIAFATGVALFIFAIAPNLEWILRGGRMDMVVLLLIVDVAAAIGLIRHFHSACRNSIENPLPIRRTRPTNAVFKSYTQWWVTWVFAVVYVLWLASGYIISGNTDLYLYKDNPESYTNLENNYESYPRSLSADTLSRALPPSKRHGGSDKDAGYDEQFGAPYYLVFSSTGKEAKSWLMEHSYSWSLHQKVDFGRIKKIDKEEFPKVKPSSRDEITGVYIYYEDIDEAFREDSPLLNPQALPKLSHVSTYISEEGHLVRLLQNRRIKSLDLYLDAPLSESAWRTVRDSAIESLCIYSSHDIQMWPSRLRRLRFLASNSASTYLSKESFLEPLKRLPHIEVLVLTYYGTYYDNSFSGPPTWREIDLATLQEISLPKWLDLECSYYGKPRPSINLALYLQHRLPTFTVRPPFYSVDFVCGSLWILAGGLLPLLFVFSMLQIQFTKPASILMPNYQRYHFQAAFWFIVLLLAIQTALLTYLGCNAIAVLALIGSVAILSLLGLYFASRFPSLPRITLVFFLFIIIAFATAVPALVGGFAPKVDWILRGGRTDVTILMLMCEVAATYGLIRYFRSLCRDSLEHPQAVRTSDGALADQGGSSIDQLAHHPSTYEWIWNTAVENRFLAAITCPAASPEKQHLLWRTAIPASSRALMGLLVAANTFLVCVVAFFHRHILNQPSTGSLLNVAILPVILVFLMPLMAFAQQRPFLQRHLIMSLDRRAWVQFIFRETARDFLPAIVCICIGLLGFHFMILQDYQTTLHWGAVAFAVSAIVYGVTLLTVTLKSARIIFGAMVYAVVMFSIIYSPFTESRLPFNIYIARMPLFLIWPPLWCIAVLTISLAYKRWLTWEFD